jgi:hypothetical protein
MPECLRVPTGISVSEEYLSRDLWVVLACLGNVSRAKFVASEFRLSGTKQKYCPRLYTRHPLPEDHGDQGVSKQIQDMYIPHMT